MCICICVYTYLCLNLGSIRWGTHAPTHQYTYTQNKTRDYDLWLRLAFPHSPLPSTTAEQQQQQPQAQEAPWGMAVVPTACTYLRRHGGNESTTRREEQVRKGLGGDGRWGVVSLMRFYYTRVCVDTAGGGGRGVAAGDWAVAAGVFERGRRRRWVTV